LAEEHPRKSSGLNDIQRWVAGDGYVGHYRRYMPTDMPRAHLVCLHGIQSHSGWYEYSSQRLCQAGYAVYYLDRRGSGLNDIDRGDTPSFRRLLQDLSEFLVEAVGPATPLPIFLAGCSWGGKLAPAFCRRYPGLIDGLILLAPGIFPKVRPSLGQRLAIAWSRLFKPTRRFPIPLSDPALFTATPRWREFIANDPLSLREATARFRLESVRLDFYVRGTPPHVTMPTLLILAEHDRIIDNQRTRRFVQRFAASDKSIIEYAGAHHTLEFEPEPDRFIDDLIQWLRQHERNLIRRKDEALAPEAVLKLGVC
jgi:alpha-beta hydrolase superfamily lysophospholipase